MTKRGDARRFAGGRLAHGACRPLIRNDRGGAVSEVSEGSKVVVAAHFVILSGEKRRVLKNGLSENMRTESKDLSDAKYKNSLPLEWKVPRKDGGWLPQRDERECTIVRPLVSSSRAKPSIFLAGGKTVPMRKSVIPSRMKYGVYRSPHFFCLTGVQRRFLASLEMTIRGKRYSHFPPI